MILYLVLLSYENESLGLSFISYENEFLCFISYDNDILCFISYKNDTFASYCVTKKCHSLFSYFIPKIKNVVIFTYFQVLFIWVINPDFFAGFRTFSFSLNFLSYLPENIPPL